MTKRKNTPAKTTKPAGFYNESLIEWRETETNVWEAMNLAAPDSAMVVHAHWHGGLQKWMFRASDGELIERQYSEIGGAPIIVNAFNAQQLAVAWLNKQHAAQKLRSDLLVEQIGAGNVTDSWGNATDGAIGYTVEQSHTENGVTVIDQATITEVSILPPPKPVLMGVDVAATQAELSGADELKKRFPRVVDPFTGKEIPADDVAAASVIPNPDALKPPAPDPDDTPMPEAPA